MNKKYFIPVALGLAVGISLVLFHAALMTGFRPGNLPGSVTIANLIFGVSLTGFIGWFLMRAQRRSEETLHAREKDLERASSCLEEEMAHHRETQVQLSQAQKLEAIGRLAGGVAHDINNVLASVMTIASAVKLDIQSGRRQESPLEDMEDILEACRRGRDLTHSLLGFARKGDFSRHAMSMVNALQDVHKLLERVAPKTIDIKVDIAPDVPQILGDPSQIKNILMNLCINGIDAMKNTGRLTLRLFEEEVLDGRHGLAQGKYVVLMVRDTGEGMSDEVISRAFDPFYTTKPEGMGTGLGLSRVWGAVKEHGGVVVVESQPGRGATFTVHLPALGPVEQDPGIRRSISPLMDITQTTLLLVDDEELIRKTTSRLLEQLGYRVITARNGMEAVDVYAGRKDEIDVVILDMMMPVMDGTAAFHRLRGLNPILPVVLCSGYSRDGAAGELLREDKVGFVQKPFSPGDITQQIQHLLK